MKFGYFVHPHLGGTFTVYRHLRSGLAPEVEVQWIGCGPHAHATRADPAWDHEQGHGFVVGRPQENGQELARALFAELEARHFDGVFVNVLADVNQMNAIRFMPPTIKRVMIVHNITPGTYAAARSIRGSVHATVGVSQRIADDLVHRFGFDADWTLPIWNAAGAPPPASGRQTRRQSDPLRAVYLGRIEDTAKGVFWLPQILHALPTKVTLTVAGDGPDLPKLQGLCASLGPRVTFLGSVLPSAVNGLLAGHDVLLGPSRFEGCGITFLEAMAAGCVPVVSRIKGVTDEMIEDTVHGLLFPVGDASAAAAAITRLLANPGEHAAMSRASAKRVEDFFTVSRMSEQYIGLLRRVEQAPRALAAPLMRENWHMPSGMRAGFRSFVPTPLKNALRTIKERHL